MFVVLESFCKSEFTSVLTNKRLKYVFATGTLCGNPPRECYHIISLVRGPCPLYYNSRGTFEQVQA